MDNVADARINNFASRDSTGRVSPESDFEQFITLTIDQIQDLIDQSVQKAVQVLQDRIGSLESTVACQGEEIAALRLSVASLESLQESEITRLAVDIAQDRRRLAALEHPIEEPAPAPSRKTTSHIDELHRLMTEEKSQQVSIAKGARLLGISKERLRQLKPLILQDGRFEMGWSTIKGKKATVIRIRRFL